MPDIDDIWDDEEDLAPFVRTEAPRRSSVQEAAPATAADGLTETAKRIAWARETAKIGGNRHGYVDADAFWNYLGLMHRQGEWLSAARSVPTAPAVETQTARPLDEWHEDMGDVLWWKFPVTEAPYVGSPTCLGQTVEIHDYKGVVARGQVGGWPGYHTHFTPLPPAPSAPSAGEA